MLKYFYLTTFTILKSSNLISQLAKKYYAINNKKYLSYYIE